MFDYFVEVVVYGFGCIVLDYGVEFVGFIVYVGGEYLVEVWICYVGGECVGEECMIWVKFVVGSDGVCSGVW